MALKTTDWVFIGLAAASGALCLGTGGWAAVVSALGAAGGLLWIVLPQLVAGLLIGGMIQELVDRDRVTRLLGAQSGMKGLGLAAVAGALTPGGPFTSFPIVYALWTAGADAGALVAYVAAWSTIGIHRLIVWELPFMGADLAVLRYAVSLPLPIIAGLAARWLVRVTRLRVQEATDS
ncbi:MAG: permease [Pseudomonadota bacterium]